jgi:hypothetical protein
MTTENIPRDNADEGKEFLADDDWAEGLKLIAEYERDRGAQEMSDEGINIPIRPDPGICGLWLANGRWGPNTYRDHKPIGGDLFELRCSLEARHDGHHRGDVFRGVMEYVPLVLDEPASSFTPWLEGR